MRRQNGIPRSVLLWPALLVAVVVLASFACAQSAAPYKSPPPNASAGVLDVGTFQAPGTGGSGSAVCNNYCDAGAAPPANCLSSVSVDANVMPISSCHLVETFTTNFKQMGSSLAASSSVGPSDSSPANTVGDYNRQNALALLTCPQAPEENPTDASYFYTGASPYVAGDACMPQPSLKTTTDLETFFSSMSYNVGYFYCEGCDNEEGISASLTDAYVNPHMTVNDVGGVQIDAVAYSPMLRDGSGSYISSAFSTNTYVFGRVPASAQHSVWTWTAQFADFSNLQTDDQRAILNNLHAQYEYTPYDDCSGYTTYYCAFSYTFGADTTLTSAKNGYMPFNEVTSGDGVQQTQVSSEAVPYFTFNAVMPTPEGQAMSQSYDVFSPWNYYTPRSSEEMFPVNTPGAVFANYDGYLLSLPDGSLNDPTDLEYGLGFAGKSAQSWPKNLVSLGLKNPELANPISITGTDTGYVFVLNESPAHADLSGIQISTDYYLSVLRPIAQGYYNVSGYPPNDMPDAYSQDQWNSNWNGYWANVIAMQSNSMYVVKSIDLGSELSGFSTEIFNTEDKLGGFTPINISADSNGDVFMTGSISGSWPAIVEITNTLSPNPSQMHVITTTLDWSTGSGVPVLSEIAATYSGGLVFAAGPSGGTVYVFAPSGASIDSQYDIDLTYGAGSSLGGFGTAMLNVSNYLYKGGLYGVPMDGTATGGAQTPNVMQNDVDHSRDFDSVAYHHPLGLQEVDGYLYVLDDWR